MKKNFNKIALSIFGMILIATAAVGSFAAISATPAQAAAPIQIQNAPAPALVTVPLTGINHHHDDKCYAPVDKVPVGHWGDWHNGSCPGNHSSDTCQQTGYGSFKHHRNWEVTLECPSGSTPDGNGCKQEVTCVPPPVLGCTNPDASNYNPAATQDDGSCIIPPVCTPQDYNGDAEGCGTPPVTICQDETASNYGQALPCIPPVITDPCTQPGSATNKACKAPPSPFNCGSRWDSNANRKSGLWDWLTMKGRGWRCRGEQDEANGWKMGSGHRSWYNR